ncbi:hypothetical protein BaRGS_00013120 [Batillaria attramentaria]|uniref:Uncharacterized protein n=1 Tax=Batillaria attramentaria TaxID=370345 RepID=A0ABD0L912_9CAEN
MLWFRHQAASRAVEERARRTIRGTVKTRAAVESRQKGVHVHSPPSRRSSVERISQLSPNLSGRQRTDDFVIVLARFSVLLSDPETATLHRHICEQYFANQVLLVMTISYR